MMRPNAQPLGEPLTTDSNGKAMLDLPLEADAPSGRYAINCSGKGATGSYAAHTTFDVY